ncbi:multidrug resistance protein 3 [Lophium mytilinum]|uniref:Multidrug resistance protein 3 n=1 Tax=Lophium mytilinum TaxID=390894 RepID=A0A6A6QSI0_9PEZI|nr:multidrug resistance protein 3 [Lophium mytilinum]
MARDHEKSGSDESLKGDVEAESKGKEGGGVKAYFRVFGYADSTSWVLNIVAFIAAMAAGVLLPLMDVIFGKFVTTFNDFAVGKSTTAKFQGDIRTLSLYFVYLFIGKFCLTYIHTLLISVSAIRTTRALRIDFLKHTLRQNIAFFDSSEAGSTSVQVTTNGNEVNSGIAEKLTLTIQSITTFFAAFIVAFAVQWKLTLITISIVPTILIVTFGAIAVLVKNEAQSLPIYSKAGLMAEEMFSSMRTVHAFWLQPLMSRKYDGLLADAQKVGNKKSPIYGTLFSIEYFCIFCGYALAFWEGIRLYSSGEIQQSGKVVTVIFAVIVAAAALTQVGPQILQITKSSSAAAELFKVIDRVPEIDSMSTEGLSPDKCIGEIEAQSLHFAYPSRPDAPVLRGLSLVIPPKKTTALVGASGSGKSTIIGLLERWYDQSEGRLLVDGMDIREVNLEWLRTRIRLVQQEPVLFNGTVFENVSFGLLGTEKAGLSPDDQLQLVKEACKAAYADEFVEQLPKGYHTEIGERAIMLSGGQKQRLAIARSIISNPQILLLDEATSALDPHAEKIVQLALDNVSENRTTLVIAHKLSTVRNADNIAVISDGKIIEQGTHDELIAANHAYAQLVRAQDLGAASGDSDEAMDGSSDAEPLDHKVSLVRTNTQVGSLHADEGLEKKSGQTMNYGLVRCVLIMLGEQMHLWYYFLLSAVAFTLGGLTFPAQSILLSKAINTFQLQGAKRTSDANFYALMFFIVALAQLGIYFTVGFVGNRIAQVVARKYRLELFDNSIRQDMAFFDRPENTAGALASRLSTYPTNLEELLGFNIGLVLIQCVNLTASCILALVIGWKLGLVVIFGALLPQVTCGYLRVVLEGKLEKETSERFSSSAGLAAEAVSAIRTVSSLTMERHIIQRYEERVGGVAARSMKSLIWTMFWYALTQSISFAAMSLGFWYGGHLVSLGEYSTTQFFIVFTGIIFSGEAAAQFFQYTSSITKAQAAANYILWFRTQIPTIRELDAPSPQDPETTVKSDYSDKDPGHATCTDLEFSYPSRPNAKVLKGINVDVHPGQFAAFVGPSGCGKTTMIALLERFYDPISGVIHFDDTPLPQRNPRLYRAQLALVQQEPVLYDASIYDNIAMGLADPSTGTTEKIEDAARQANIHEFVVSLPDGYNTLCGGRGSQLSGGQRQRIAIARALVRRPRLLLLDEATSALDTESERVVQAALGRAKEGRTTVAVAHRLSTVKDADVILVFEKGRVVEVGTHGELLGRRGVYWEMCRGQALDRAV